MNTQEIKESKLNFPIDFVFNVSTFANDFTATDASGATMAYVRQKMFKMKEDIQVFANESRDKVVFNIRADRWIDFSAAYAFTDAEGREVGKVARKGWKSLWKASYDVIGSDQQMRYKIQEESVWVRFFDNLLGEIPILGIFTGYFFNPSYKVVNNSGEIVARISKRPSFLGRKFQVQQVGDLNNDEVLIMLALMMMVLLERRRG